MRKKSIFSLGPNGPILQIFLVVQYLVRSLKMPSDGSNNLIFLDRVKEHCVHKLKWSFPRFLPRPLALPCSLFHTSSGQIASFLYLIALGPAELTLPVWKKMQLPVETPCLIQSHLTSVFILKSDANSQINNEKRSQEGAVSN